MTHSGRAPRLITAALSLLLAAPAAALDLDWPAGAERVVSRSDAIAGFRIANGVFDGSSVPALSVEGDLIEEVWQVPGEAGDPARLLAFARAQLAAQGFEIVFACAARSCGGFDFRYALPIAEEPEMHVDLGDFHYLAATRDTPEGPEHLALTLSQGGRLGYVHLARIAPAGALPAAVTPSSRQNGDASDTGLIARMTTEGHAVLEDLAFATGASSLSGARYESLVTLAAWLAEERGRRVVLVGHTDTEGTLEGNIELSRARAAAVRAFLIEEFGTDPGQVEAAGIGYLAPRATNVDPAGREANRRVEVVLIGG